VVVVDSVAALVPQAEIAGEMGDSHVGLQARLMSQALRKLTGTISKSGCCLIFINQIRMKIGVMFGNPETTTGGNALKFYASVRIEIRRIETITQGAENSVGNHVRVKVVKNKVAPPFKKVDVDIFFGKGVSAIGSLVDAAVSHGLVVKSGSWYSYGEERIGQGRDNAKEFLEKNPELAAEIDLTIRKKLFPQYFAKPAETAENKAQAGVAAAQAAGLSAGTSGLAAKASLKAKAPAAAATEHEGASDELF
jgi:recombination protein RecA